MVAVVVRGRADTPRQSAGASCRGRGRPETPCILARVAAAAAAAAAAASARGRRWPGACSRPPRRRSFPPRHRCCSRCLCRASPPLTHVTQFLLERQHGRAPVPALPARGVPKGPFPRASCRTQLAAPPLPRPCSGLARGRGRGALGLGVGVRYRRRRGKDREQFVSRPQSRASLNIHALSLSTPQPVRSHTKAQLNVRRSQAQTVLCRRPCSSSLPPRPPRRTPRETQQQPTATQRCRRRARRRGQREQEDQRQQKQQQHQGPLRQQEEREQTSAS